MSGFDISTSMTAGYAGLVTKSLQIESGKSAATQGVGLFVAVTTGKQTVKAPAAAADVTAGCAGLVIPMRGHYDVSAGSEYAIGEMFPILRKGRAWVLTEEAVTKGNPVYVRFTSDGGSNTTLGKVRSDADISGSARAAALPNSQYIESTTGAALVEIEFSLP